MCDLQCEGLWLHRFGEDRPHKRHKGSLAPKMISLCQSWSQGRFSYGDDYPFLLRALIWTRLPAQSITRLGHDSGGQARTGRRTAVNTCLCADYHATSPGRAVEAGRGVE